MRISMNRLLEWADEEGFGVVSFNITDIWDCLGIIRAAEREHAPVILQMVPPVVDTVGIPYLNGMCAAAVESARVPVVYHLDHSVSPAMCFEAIDCGYPSVMIDASSKPLEENIGITGRVVSYAHPKGVFVEGEIGRIRGSGWEGVPFKEGEEFLTRVEDAVLYARSTGVDSLAVGIGNAHGFYTERPQLNIERLAEINEAVDVKLVLHGGTGIPEDAVRAAVRNGINKVNVGTCIFHAYMDALRPVLAATDKAHYHDHMFEQAVEAVSHTAAEWMRKTMSNNRA